MNILTADNLTKAYGVRKVLDQAFLSMEDHDKVGLIGINGTGKSTLIKIIAGLEDTDEGKIIKANHVVIGYLPQTPVFPENATVITAAMGEKQDTNTETEAKRMLTKLGVYNFDQKCSELSGGQRKRLALVSVLLAKTDLLLLDEPTNHLDHEMADWLEEQLKKYRGAILMVTHDRYFLDSVTNRILEIDHGKMYSYESNYSGYLETKAQRMAMEDAAQKKRENLLRTELEWVRRGAQARTTKQKARLQRFEALSNTEAPLRDNTVELSSAVSRLGRTTVEIEHLSKSYGDRVLIRDFNYIFLKNDRIGFVGSNGCGKTTLMKLLTGAETPSEGTITVGQTVKISYYAQEIGNETMPPNQRVIDYIRDTAEFVETAEGKFSAARMLEKFLFAGEDQYGLLGKLSGGEKRRLYLLKVLMESPNVLILDEPTNDLDIATLQILEAYLDDFQGIVIVVSHDRYFLDRTVRRIFAFEEGGVLKQYEGGYTDYHNRWLETHEEEETTAGRKNIGGSSNEIASVKQDRNSWKQGREKKKKFTYQEQKDYESIEGEIAALEEKIAGLEAEILKNSRDFVKLNDLTKQKTEAEELLETKMDRWMYLEELAASFLEP